ncbi:high-temperature-induced dauer-formation protein-domain-containing protein [Dimargaris cristalligena]|uniref:High-temperature-induced dauer-formation protein-domain-containing protein n=1 Tax=Dimargaris cristalligena TaxID=215637 RepID=A0A4P9ZYZ4_9FUNG|nr:high-temperature-induced dauer-formation protein-domain-containing protein [Dimargaris cristalligena]|eukprot:RKP38976.1 high-temperature-induced dauer-formation protein-domain-containing protein [Dimargaris cristalligena]
MGATDSKIALRTGIFRLAKERNLNENDEYWSSLWSVPESADDIFSLFTAQDLRRIRDQAPENFATLFTKLYERIVQIKSSPIFTPSTDTSQPPTSPQALQAITKQLLNCIRLLTRLIPFVYEKTGAPGDEAVLAASLFWSTHKKGSRCFGERLVSTVLDLLFLSDFTVPKSEDAAQQAQINYCIWESGIGQTQLVATSKEFVFHRLEVMRLLLCLLSESMYTPGSTILTQPNRALDYLAFLPDKKVVLTLLCSLINTALKFKSAGWGIPYKMKPAHDPHDLLAVYCIQTLLVLLNAAKNASTISTTAADGESVGGEENGKPGISGNGSPHPRPHSIEDQPAADVNLKFSTFLIESEEFMSVIVAVSFFSWDNKADPLYIGQVRMAVFLLHIFSEEPRFGERLNGNFDQAILPTAMRIPANQISHADWLIYTFYTLITTTKTIHAALHPTMLMVLRNIAPYLKGLTPFASDKLMRLLTIYSSPTVLLANESNYRSLLYVLEIINYVIYYQMSSNMQFLYALIRTNDTVRKLAQLDFATALVEWEDVQKAREQRVLAGMSDKARGKLPEASPTPRSQPGSPTSVVSGRPSNGGGSPVTGLDFYPTLEWFNSWYPKLPLRGILILLDATVPYVQDHLAQNPLQSDTQVLVLLRSNEFHQRLPRDLDAATNGAAPPIAIRHLRWSKPLSAWYRGLLWSQIYVAGTAPLGLWNGTNIQLFQVKSQ